MNDVGFRELYARRSELLFKKDYARAPLYAKAVTHRVTPLFVYAFAKIGVTPNQTTLLSLIAGLAAAALFCVPTRWAPFAAALCLELCYVMDSVDGQLARLTNRHSKTGAFFDVVAGNYLVHPLVFLFIGLGQFRVTGGAAALFCGGLAALSYLWMGLLWDVRANVLLESLNRDRASARGQSLETLKSTNPPFLQRLFSWTHKICTFPRVMNVITVVSAAELLTGNLSLLSYVILAYAALLPFVAISKATRMVMCGEIDRAYEALAIKP